MNTDEIIDYVLKFVSNVKDWIKEHPNQRPQQLYFSQIPRNQYHEFIDSGFWTWGVFTDEEIAYFQLFNTRMVVEYKYFIQAVSRIMGRVVIRYELIYDEFYQELLGQIPTRFIQEVIATLYQHNPKLSDDALIHALESDMKHCENK